MAVQTPKKGPNLKRHVLQSCQILCEFLANQENSQSRFVRAFCQRNYRTKDPELKSWAKELVADLADGAQACLRTEDLSEEKSCLFAMPCVRHCRDSGAMQERESGVDFIQCYLSLLMIAIPC